jgi:hypothetical protein
VLGYLKPGIPAVQQDLQVKLMQVPLLPLRENSPHQKHVMREGDLEVADEPGLPAQLFQKLLVMPNN